jgi:hypothetical protein
MKTLLSVIFIFLFSFVAFGQTNITVTTEDGKKVVLKSDKTWEYVIESPKKETANQSTGSFSVDNIEDVKKFSKSISQEVKKSEFETEDQYIKRLTKLANEKQFNGKPIKQIAFLIEPLSFDYLAEGQTFNVTVYGESNGVTFVDRDRYGSFSRNSIRRDFNMSPEKAKELKPLMEIIILGFPVRSDYRLEAVPTQMIIRNKNTGEVYFNTALDNSLGVKINSSSSSEPITANSSSSDEASTSSSSPASKSSTSDSSKTVQVRGYTRKDGTYVKPHTRSAPRKP